MITSKNGRIQSGEKLWAGEKLVIDGQPCTVGWVRIGSMNTDRNEVHGGYRRSVQSQVWDIIRDSDRAIVARGKVDVGSRSNPNYFEPNEIHFIIGQP